MLNRLSNPLVAIVPLLALSSVGCVDPKAELTNFGNRVVDAGPSDLIDAPVLDDIPDISGQYLLAVDPKPVDEGKLIRFIVNVEATVMPGGGLVTRLTSQPVAVADGQLIGAGPSITVTDLPINASGEFIVPFDQVIPGAADTIAPGLELEAADAELRAEIRSGMLFCGRLTGMEIRTGMTLEGSTFGAIAIEAGTIGEALPMPVGECPARE